MRRRLALPVLAVLALCICSASAAASYDPVAGGSTTITLDPGFRALLKRAGVSLRATAPVKQSGTGFTFPVSAGRLDPLQGRGHVDHLGSIVFVAGGRRLPLKSLTLKTTQRNSPLTAKFGGGQLKLASRAQMTTARDGFGLRVTVRSIRLSAKVATRLDKKLDLRGVFKQGQPFGRSVTVASPATVAVLPSGRATLAPAPAFLAKLKAQFVSLNSVFPAELSPGPVLSFPIIAGGAIAPDASSGTLRLGGGLEFLKLGVGQVFWQEPWLDLGAAAGSAEVDVEPAPAFPGKLGRVGIFDFGSVAASSDPASRTITLTGLPLTLSGQTAAAFNQAFAAGTSVFQAGEALGALTFAAKGQ